MHLAGVTVGIDPDHGSRLAHFAVDGDELLVTQPTNGDSLSWGCYPMVPFAGRVRHGRFEFDGVTHHLPTRAAPHAIHGTVDDVVWHVESHDDTSCVLTTRLTEPWDAVVTHTIRLGSGRLELRLRIDDNRRRMPVQVGWHPWFRRPDRFAPEFEAWYPRDPDGIAGARPVEPARFVPGRTDDCFVDPRPRTTSGDPDRILTFERNGLVMMLSSSCRHWVVYDEPEHATCIEPQLGPPNAFEHDPTVLDPGDELEHWFVVSWHRSPPGA